MPNSNLNPLMPDGNKKVTHTLSMRKLFVPPGIKGLRKYLNPSLINEFCI